MLTKEKQSLNITFMSAENKAIATFREDSRDIHDNKQTQKIDICLNHLNNQPEDPLSDSLIAIVTTTKKEEIDLGAPKHTSATLWHQRFKNMAYGALLSSVNCVPFIGSMWLMANGVSENDHIKISTGFVAGVISSLPILKSVSNTAERKRTLLIIDKMASEVIITTSVVKPQYTNEPIIE